jgi:hypothetical protein
VKRGLNFLIDGLKIITDIKSGFKNIKLSDLKICDIIVIIGSPNDKGQIEAKLIRFFHQKQALKENSMNKKTQIGILILIILAAISYFAFSKISKNKGETKYVLTRAKRETISVSVSGSGNIEAVNEVNILPNVSGKIQNIFVKKGDFVKEGQVLVKLDTSDIENTISGLETQIQTIKMSLESYQKNLEKLENSKIDASNTLDKTYRDTFDFTVSLFDLFSNFFLQVKDWATKSSFGDENEMSDFDYYRHVVNFYSPDKENLVGDEEEKEFQKLKYEYENLKLTYQKLSSFSQKEALAPFFSELDSF